MAYSFYTTANCSDLATMTAVNNVPYNQNWEMKDLASIQVDRVLGPTEHLDFSGPGQLDQICGDFEGVYGEGKVWGQLTPNKCIELPKLSKPVKCYRLWREGAKDTGDVPN